MASSGSGDAQRVVDSIQSNFAEMGAALTKAVSALNAPISIEEPDSRLSPDEHSLARAEAKARARHEQGSAELSAMAAIRTRIEAEHARAVEELAAAAALRGVAVDRVLLKSPLEHFSNVLRSHGPDRSHARRVAVIAARVDTLAHASAHLIEVSRKLGCQLTRSVGDEPANGGGSESGDARSNVEQIHACYDKLTNVYGHVLAAHIAEPAPVKLDPAIEDPDEAREAAELQASEQRGYSEFFDFVLERQGIEKNNELAIDRLTARAARCRRGIVVDRAVLCAPHATFSHLLHEGRHADRVKWLRELLSAIPRARRHLSELAALLRGELQHGRDWLPCGLVPWGAATQTDEWRKLKSELRSMGRAAQLEIFDIDEDRMRALEAEKAQAERMEGWREQPGEAHVADVWAMRDIEWTPHALEQIFHHGDYGSGADPHRHFRVAGEADMLNHDEIQARACRQLRARMALPEGGRASGRAATLGSDARTAAGSTGTFHPNRTDRAMMKLIGQGYQQIVEIVAGLPGSQGVSRKTAGKRLRALEARGYVSITGSGKGMSCALTEKGNALSSPKKMPENRPQTSP